jgi:hypothetical protein
VQHALIQIIRHLVEGNRLAEQAEHFFRQKPGEHFMQVIKILVALAEISRGVGVAGKTRTGRALVCR